MLKRIVIAAAVLLSAAAPAARAQEPGEPTRAQETEDVLRPGDLIRLRIWREPDLSGDFLVKEDGVVVFPRLGELVVTNESPESLRERLLNEYRRYLRNPSIDLIFLRRVNIHGAVRNPGLYPLDPTMTIADAVALAGGAISYGQPDKVQLLRDGVVLTTRITQSTRIADLPIRSGDQIFVPERSWIERNSGIVASVVSATVSLVIALFINR